MTLAPTSKWSVYRLVHNGLRREYTNKKLGAKAVGALCGGRGGSWWSGGSEASMGWCRGQDPSSWVVSPCAWKGHPRFSEVRGGGQGASGEPGAAGSAAVAAATQG